MRVLPALSPWDCEIFGGGGRGGLPFLSFRVPGIFRGDRLASHHGMEKQAEECHETGDE